ncbi:hypothetical protein [Flavobacterium cyanobacteriorum]|uniref:hypothetical protein n=1 Tax=Flavobacterium cyanobacteriorum TaxID=2022802 RepID=UPI0013FDF398|nr:hypothetical protein [Flavobacterium cyanobacteriorum]
MGTYITSDKDIRYKLIVLPLNELDRSAYLQWCKVNMVYTERSLLEAEKPFARDGQYDVFGIEFNDKVVIDIILPRESNS